MPERRAQGTDHGTRREFLLSLGALGASAMLPGCVASGTPAPVVNAGQPHRIDIHHHLVPPKYAAMVKKYAPDENPPTGWSPARSPPSPASRST